MIGDRIYEVAFIADPDGMPIELLRLQAQLPPPKAAIGSEH
jgi:hypothetical protein